MEACAYGEAITTEFGMKVEPSLRGVKFSLGFSASVPDFEPKVTMEVHIYVGGHKNQEIDTDGNSTEF